MDLKIVAEANSMTGADGNVCENDAVTLVLKCCDTENLVAGDGPTVSQNYLRALHRTIGGGLRQDNFRNFRVWTFDYPKISKKYVSVLRQIEAAQADNSQCVSITITDPCDNSSCDCVGETISGVLTLGGYTMPPGCEAADLTLSFEESNSDGCDQCEM